MQNIVACPMIALRRSAFVNEALGSQRLTSKANRKSPCVAIVRKSIATRAALLVLTAVVLCAPFQSAFAKGGWLTQCLNDGTGDLSDAECYVEYTNRLKREQAGVIKRIRAALSRQGPAETDYPKALALLNQSQKKWLSFVTTDCLIVTEVFGGGNAAGFAEETCVIEHYRTRNAQLKKLEVDYLSN